MHLSYLDILKHISIGQPITLEFINYIINYKINNIKRNTIRDFVRYHRDKYLYPVLLDKLNAKIGYTTYQKIRTPWQTAAIMREFDILEFLLYTNPKQDIDEICSHGETALFSAVLSNNTSAVSMLLKHNANINHVNKHNMSVLHSYICFVGNNMKKNMIYLLLENNLDIYLRTDNNTAQCLIDKYCKSMYNLLDILEEINTRDIKDPGIM